MGKRVVVLGGGVGGMSAAHELAERDLSATAPVAQRLARRR